MTLIIGYGNRLRTDDGAGYYAAEQLGGMAQHQLTPELAEDISRADAVVFVDAREGGEPGTITVEEIAPAAAGGAFTHHVTPAGLLEMARTLYSRAPSRAWLVTISGGSFDPGESLTPEVTAALPKLVETIGAL